MPERRAGQPLYEYDAIDEMFRRAIDEKEPQFITRHGHTVAVVLDFGTYAHLLTETGAPDA